MGRQRKHKDMVSKSALREEFRLVRGSTFSRAGWKVKVLEIATRRVKAMAGNVFEQALKPEVMAKYLEETLRQRGWLIEEDDRVTVLY